MKITKEHVGKKVICTAWYKGEEETVIACGETLWIGKDCAGRETHHRCDLDWQLYEEPLWFKVGDKIKSKDWVEYYFIWDGTRDRDKFYGDLYKKGELLKSAYFCHLSQDNWEFYTSKIKRRAAPALVKHLCGGFSLSSRIFDTEIKAKTHCGELFLKWPASETSWVEWEE